MVVVVCDFIKSYILHCNYMIKVGKMQNFFFCFFYFPCVYMVFVLFSMPLII